MRSVDTNILLYSLNSDCAEFAVARAVMDELFAADDVVLCELVLVDLYLLLRSPKVLRKPLSSADATAICQTFRRHPHWRVVESAPVMDKVWSKTADVGFPRRRIVDLRLALTLLHHGVHEFLTHNPDDFRGVGFRRVHDPYAGR